MLWRACDSLHSNDMFAQTCYASHILFFADFVVVAKAVATYMHSLLANVCCRCWCMCIWAFRVSSQTRCRPASTFNAYDTCEVTNVYPDPDEKDPLADTRTNDKFCTHSCERRLMYKRYLFVCVGRYVPGKWYYSCLLNISSTFTSDFLFLLFSYFSFGWRVEKESLSTQTPTDDHDDDDDDAGNDEPRSQQRLFRSFKMCEKKFNHCDTAHNAWFSLHVRRARHKTMPNTSHTPVKEFSDRIRRRRSNQGETTREEMRRNKDTRT